MSLSVPSVLNTLCFVTLSSKHEVHVTRNFRTTRLSLAHSGGVATKMPVLLVGGVRVNATLKKGRLLLDGFLQVWEKRILVHLRRYAPSFQASFAYCLITDFSHHLHLSVTSSDCPDA